MDETRLDGQDSGEHALIPEGEDPALNADLDLDKIKGLKRPRPVFVDRALDWISTYLRPGPPLGIRLELLLSAGVVAAVVFAFWVTRWPLANWPAAAPDLSLYILHPILWTGVAALAGYGWLRLENPPEYRPVLTQVALGVGLLHVTVLVFAGVFGSLADSPVVDWLFDYPFNALYVVTTLAAAEVARSYLFEVWRRIDREAAFAAVTVIFAVAALTAAELTPFSSLGELGEVVGTRWIPVLAISILATALVEIGGPAMSFAYRVAILGFAWLSPMLPDVHWSVLAVIGALLPWVAWGIMGAVQARIERDEEEEETQERRDPPGLRTPPKQDNEFLDQTPERRWWAIAKPILAFMTFTALLLGGLFIVFGSGLTGFRMQIIDDDSMAPAYERGDTVVIDEHARPDGLVLGDVIRIVQGEETLIRRIVAIHETADEELLFVTKGDNLEEIEHAVVEDEIAGEVLVRIPNLGNVALWWRD